MRTRVASCTCGQLRIEVRGEPLGTGICHCLVCQRRTGSVFATVAAFAPPYRVDGTATEYVRVTPAGERVVFRFCPVCGSTVFNTEKSQEDKWVQVAVGAFGDPDFPPPRDSVFTSRKHRWVQLPGDIVCFDEDPD